MKKITKDNMFIQNDYIDDIINDPDEYSYRDMLYASLLTPYNYKLYDYMLLNYAFDEDSEIFRDYLYYNINSDSYINRVANSNDEVLKANLVIFIENNLFNTLFDNVHNFIEKVKNYDVYPAKYRIGPLITISEFNCSDKDIIELKKAIKILIMNDFEYKNEFNKEELIIQLNDFYKQIDDNHSKEKSYILNI